MTPLDAAVKLTLTLVLIVGAYQFYFWCQRHPLRPPIEWSSALDRRIPRWVSWIWIYSGLYYPVIVLTALSAPSMQAFNYMAFSYLVLLAAQMAFFLLFPVRTPASWRVSPPSDGPSERFLRLVQRFDSPLNCFPSMHVSVAMLTALHLRELIPILGPWTFAFPLAIGVSALLTKQHYLVDLPAGALLGWACFAFYRLGLAP